MPRGLGKTTFINTLFSTTIKNYAEHKLRHKKQMDKTVRFAWDYKEDMVI